MRWSLLKTGFPRRLDKVERRRPSRLGKPERGIWQRRYWKHSIRDADDLERHVAYVHFNPVKHGWAKRPADWPHSTFHTNIARVVAAQEGAQARPMTRAATVSGEVLGFLRSPNLVLTPRLRVQSCQGRTPCPPWGV